MTMVPKFSLVEQKEEQQTKQQGDKELVGLDPRLKSLRQQMQKSGGQQSTRSQAEHVLRVAAHHAKTQPGG